jgi:hypothetical protein
MRKQSVLVVGAFLPLADVLLATLFPSSSNRESRLGTGCIFTEVFIDTGKEAWLTRRQR